MQSIITRAPTLIPKQGTIIVHLCVFGSTTICWVTHRVYFMASLSANEASHDNDTDENYLKLISSNLASYRAATALSASELVMNFFMVYMMYKFTLTKM